MILPRGNVCITAAKTQRRALLRTKSLQRGKQLYETIYQLRTLSNQWIQTNKQTSLHAVPNFNGNPLDCCDVLDTIANENLMKSVEEMSG